MAIDSQKKRMSVTGVGRPYLRATFPVSGKDQGWRASVGNIYSGVTLTAAAVIALVFAKIRALDFMGLNINREADQITIAKKDVMGIETGFEPYE